MARRHFDAEQPGGLNVDGASLLRFQRLADVNTGTGAHPSEPEDVDS
jgi:hypothetical protein